MVGKSQIIKEEKTEAERRELLEERDELLKGDISFEEKKRINQIEKRLGLKRKDRMSSAFVPDYLLED